MQTSSNRTLIIVIVAAAALLIGCCCGVVIGGLGASLIGVSSIAVSDSRGVMPELNLIPLPQSEATPESAVPVQPERPPQDSAGAPRLSGAYVRDVATGSPADQAGLQSGDFILSVDDQVIDASNRLADILAGYKPGDRVTLSVLKAGSDQPEEVTVRLAANDTSPGRAYLGVFFMDVTPRP